MRADLNFEFYSNHFDLFISHLLFLNKYSICIFHIFVKVFLLASFLARILCSAKPSSLKKICKFSNFIFSPWSLNSLYLDFILPNQFFFYFIGCLAKSLFSEFSGFVFKYFLMISFNLLF
jgi:hypothetical protein